MVTLEDIRQAQERIRGVAVRTPLVPFPWPVGGRRLHFKAESFQPIGAFKIRGAYNKIASLSEAARQRGVITYSSGNHAQAVAYVARALDLRSLVLMPENTPRNYVDATRSYGAEIKFVPDAAAAFDQVANYEKEGWAFIHPFDDALVMAGQGTLGLEILEDAPQVTDVVVSIGGGGLMTGVATAIKSLKPAVRIWGVETQGADCMAKSLAAGTIVTLEAITSVARTLGAPAPSERTFAAARELLESVTVVSDSEALAALRFLLERLKVLTEPAASCTLAAADRLQDRFSAERHVVLVLCGGNMSVEDLVRFS